MDTRLLFLPDPNLSPEARWFLLQWSRIVGLDRPLTCSLQELYCCLGISPQHAKPVLQKLVLLGYLNYETVRKGRGRPISSYKVSTGFRNRLEKLVVQKIIHLPEIEALGDKAVAVRALRKREGRSLMSGEERANSLAPGTYCLLSVLLANAETPGIVRGMSYGRLQIVTGMTKERLKSQLSKLKKIGVIVRHEPGSLRSREGASMRSIYTLELEHSLLLGKDSLAVTVLFGCSGKLGGVNKVSGYYDAALTIFHLNKQALLLQERIEKQCIAGVDERDPVAWWYAARCRDRYSDAYDQLFKNARSLLPPLNFIEPAADSLMTIHRLGMGRVLKAHVKSYALMLLSNHWEDLLYGKGGYCDPIKAVKSAIQMDCSSLVTEHSDKVDSALFTFVYAMAHHLAVVLQNSLNDIERYQSDFDFTAAAFLMRPIQYRGDELWELKVYLRPSEGITYLNKVLVNLPSVSLTIPEEMDELISIALS